jgi:hypothetical protein
MLKTMIVKNENVDVAPDPNDLSAAELAQRIKQIKSYLLSKWKTILIFTVIGGIGGYYYAFTKQPIYTATTTFVLEAGDNAGGLGQYAGLASMVGIDVGSGAGGGIFQGDNILELYKSRAIIQKTLMTTYTEKGKNKMLIDRYIDGKGLRIAWAKIPKLSHLSFRESGAGEQDARLQDSVMKEIVNDIKKNSLSVDKLDKKLSIIKVDVKSADEFFAKTFNDQIVKHVNDFYVQTKTKKSLENVAILQKKTDSVRHGMNSAIYYAAAVSDATPNLNPTKQIQRLAPMQRSQFNAETNKAILGELMKNLELSKIALLKDAPLIQVVDQPIYPLDVIKMNKIQQMLLWAVIFAVGTITYLLLAKLFERFIN